jgi:phosphonopyruvate decarboxylase
VLDPGSFVLALEEHHVSFFTGVPDSVLMPFSAQLSLSIRPERHIIAANEGAAVALAAGWHLATDTTPCVYMQNSGLGNAVNPLVSLADPEVYGIPMVLVIGWRGEVSGDRQLTDEPQHKKQGLITRDLLSCLGIPHAVVGANTANAADVALSLVQQAVDERRPTAILVRKGTFAPVSAPTPMPAYRLIREDTLALVLDALPDDVIIVATTGKLSRELYELRIARGQSTDRDFLTVGSMGHAMMIASGVALAKPQKRIVCLDGDGAMIMHMGALTTSATIANLIHIVINNGAHESVGGQPTQGFRIDMPMIAQACGYEAVRRAENASEVREAITAALAASGASFIEIRTRPGSRADLGRPKSSPAQSKHGFMRFLGSVT